MKDEHKRYLFMTTTPVFATAFCHSEGISPNLGLGGKEKNAAYYRCMVVFFFSVRRLYPDTLLILFTDRELPEPWRGDLKSLSVETIIIPGNDIRYCRDVEISNEYPGCLFTLDVLSFLASACELSDSPIFLCDPDCLLVRQLDELTGILEETQTVAVLPLEYGLSLVKNGQSRASLTLLLLRRNGLMPEATPVTFLGGEFIGIHPRCIKEVATATEDWWQVIKEEAHLFGTTYTEEHILSLSLGAVNSAGVLSGGEFVRRIFTSREFCTWDGTEEKLCLWHLPAEKNGFFTRMYCRITSGKTDFTTQDEFFRIVLQELFPKTSTTLLMRLWSRICRVNQWR